MSRLRKTSQRAVLVMAFLSATSAWSTSTPSNTAQPIAITVDAGADHHPISPLIYGISFGTTAVLKDLRVPINRSGGNSASTYNWRLDARNAGKDWYYESLPVNPNDINDQFGERFVELTQAAGATPILTIPMVGRVARLGPDRKRLASFSIEKYGPQQGRDLNGMVDAGNGIAPDGTPITGNDPDDTSVPDDPQSQQARVKQLVKRFGSANAGGVRYYAMGNEPSVWHIIHRDIHPTGAHASEIASKVLDYSRAVKTADPQALIMAPEEWGWLGYHRSGYDQQYASTNNDLLNTPDTRTETQGMDYVPWLLKQWKQAGHPIDVFSLHFYPQSGEYTESGISDSPAIARMRNISTRNLWDPDYKDPTWINSVVALIPRMRQWVDTYYHPGTPIALTEYNWGGDTLMNGATAQADLLGIFGREKLDIATRWGAPAQHTPVYKVFKLYRNYDDKGSGFGSINITASAPDPDTVSAFAALRKQDNALTLILINKQADHTADTSVALARFAPSGTMETWQLANYALARLPDARYTNSTLHASLPPQSVTLFVLRGAKNRLTTTKHEPPSPRASPRSTSGHTGK